MKYKVVKQFSYLEDGQHKIMSTNEIIDINIKVSLKYSIPFLLEDNYIISISDNIKPIESFLPEQNISVDESKGIVDDNNVESQNISVDESKDIKQSAIPKKWNRKK